MSNINSERDFEEGEEEDEDEDEEEADAYVVVLDEEEQDEGDVKTSLSALRQHQPQQKFQDDDDVELLLRHKGHPHGQELHRILQDGKLNTAYAVPETISHSKSRSIVLPRNWRRKTNKEKSQDGADSSEGPVFPRPSATWWKNNLVRSIPIIPELATYNLFKLRNDVIAGVTVAILAIPLGMSYARLAGLPAYYGLYASFVPPLVYPIFGTSPQLSLGPAALISLLVSSGVGAIVEKEQLTENDPEYMQRYTQLAIQCCFLVGITNLALGLLRLGFITQFLSRPLISGFTSGAAIIIASSQIQHIMGYSIPSSNKFQVIVRNLILNIEKFDWPTFVLGVTSIGVLELTKRLAQNETLLNKYPFIKWLRAVGPILVSIVSMILVYTLDLNTRGIKIVGPMPAGLPNVTIQDWLPLPDLADLLLIVISMVIVGFVQSIAIAKRIAYRRGGYEIDPSQELVAYGMANLVGAMFQCYPTSAAIGQSAVNDEIGALTRVASFITGLVVMVVLLFLTPVFKYMPLAVLAAIVMAFVLGMVDFAEAIYLFKVHKFDFTVWVVAFWGTMLLGVEYGLGIAVALSLLIVIYKSSYPQTAVLGRLPGTTLYRNVKQYPDAEEYDELVIIRIDAPLYFANALNVRDKIRKYKRKAESHCQSSPDQPTSSSAETGPKVHYIILDMSPVSHVDTTALHMLEDMYTTQQRLGVKLCFCDPSISVMKRLTACGLADRVGRECIFSSVVDAVAWCLHDIDEKMSSNSVMSSHL